MQKLLLIVLLLAVLAGGGWYIMKNSSKKTSDNAGAVQNSEMLQNGDSQNAVFAGEETYFEGVKGYFARPEEPGAYPGVVMIHEWWGLNDNIRNMARELAKEGYMVVAVDLFEGKVATTPDEARAQTSSLNQNRALQNLQAATRFLRDRGAAKVGSLGWCFGGGQSLKLSLSGEPLDATVIYYGNLVTDKKELEKIDWPVLGIFGDKDTSIPVATVNSFRDALASAGVKNSIHVYPGVGHAFANPSGMNYAPNETKDAWAKTLAFLAENLKGEKIPAANAGEIKEFSMDAFYEMKDGKPSAGFSLKEVNVKKGDRVRIKVTNTNGMHDFKIDEYGISRETPQGEEQVIEFTADKAGEFKYYCSKFNHRQIGQEGILRVRE